MRYQVYGDKHSGNCYKVQLLLELLQQEYDWHAVDILAGDTKSADFSELNPAQQIPLLVISDGIYLSESNAILNYLAEGTAYLPQSRLERARVLQWQFYEQYSHEPNIAVARFISRYLGMPEDRREEYEQKQIGGHEALSVMESRLSDSSWLIGDAATIADISLYAYTHVADEGGFSLSQYPGIQAWLKRIQNLPGYVGMPD